MLIGLEVRSLKLQVYFNSYRASETIMKMAFSKIEVSDRP